MSKRNHDEFASDYDLQFNFEQECECNLCFQADEEASNPSNFNLSLGPLRNRVCPGLPSKAGLEDPDQEYDNSHQSDEEHDLSHQKHEEYDHSEHYYDDSEYGNSYQYYDEQEEEEEDGMPDFECKEDMHRWMLKKAEDSHRIAPFKNVGNQYPVLLKCEDKDSDKGLIKAMMMASNLCDVHDEGLVEDV